jgi:hypothetical protein
MLAVIERDNYCLRCEYPERKSLRAGLWMMQSTLTALFASPFTKMTPHKFTAQTVRLKKR